MLSYQTMSEFIHTWLDSMRETSSDQDISVNPFTETECYENNWRRSDLFLNGKKITHIVYHEFNMVDPVQIGVDQDLRFMQKDLHDTVFAWIRENIHLIGKRRGHYLHEFKLFTLVNNEEKPVNYVKWFLNNLNPKSIHEVTSIRITDDILVPGHKWCDWKIC